MHYWTIFKNQLLNFKALLIYSKNETNKNTLKNIQKRRRDIQLHDTKFNTRLKCDFRVLLNIICWIVSLLITSSKKGILWEWERENRAKYAFIFECHTAEKYTASRKIQQVVLDFSRCPKIKQTQENKFASLFRAFFECKFNITFFFIHILFGECACESLHNARTFLETLGWRFFVVCWKFCAQHRRPKIVTLSHFFFFLDIYVFSHDYHQYHSIAIA